MTAKPKTLSWLSLFLAVVSFVAAYFSPPFPQAVMIEVASTLLGLGLGLILINIYLQLDEKREAAGPLLNLIGPSIERLHNDFFIRPGRLAFGTPGFTTLIDAYQANGRKPEALSPDQRDRLYELVKGQREALSGLYQTLHEQLRELTLLLGWSYNPRLMKAALQCRLYILKFNTLSWNDDLTTKLTACELFLDIEATSGAAVTQLMVTLGRQPHEWLHD